MLIFSERFHTSAALVFFSRFSSGGKNLPKAVEAPKPFAPDRLLPNVLDLWRRRSSTAALLLSFVYSFFFSSSCVDQMRTRLQPHTAGVVVVGATIEFQ